ncbi:MAG: VOC family protein [Actinomycetota bacterium]|nr:VOC family protein [Actinomycetota bacterium]
MDITGVHHVSLNVVDVPEARRFYVDVLGLTDLPRPDFGFPGAWLGLADGRQVHLIGKPEYATPAPGQHFALQVPDLDAAVAELRRRGIDVRGPKSVPGSGRQCFFADPSGNEIELNETPLPTA